jgi:hypothetical protein
VLSVCLGMIDDPENDFEFITPNHFSCIITSLSSSDLTTKRTRTCNLVILLVTMTDALAPEQLNADGSSNEVPTAQD